ncbi:MAG: diacylglycerol kinase [Nitrospirae bacterium]|nr:diacylglycerol kinase [Nitrospirota bacterium]
MKPKNWLESVNLAIEGILYVAKTQRHMRYHFWVAAAILFFSLFLNITRTEFLILAFAILFVLFAEMINTAIEVTVDIMSPSYSKPAKIAKDTAAGAVLIASIGAVVTGYLVLYPHIKEPFVKGIDFAKNSPEHITFIALVIVIIAVIMSKAYSKKGRPLYGGIPSGHAAVAFAIWISILFITRNALISILTLVLALIISHSRIALGAHTRFEVILGAVLGALITLLLFQLFG